MAHPIHKHMGGMKSAERFDAKEAYNKRLSSKARMHYLENDIADHKGSPARAEGGRKNHKMSNSEYEAHLQSPRGKEQHGSPAKQKGNRGDHNTMTDGEYSRHLQSPRGKQEHGSPAKQKGNRGDHSAMTDGEYSRHLETPRGKKEHGAGMSRYEDKGMSRQASPLNGFNSYTSDTHKHPHAEGASRKSSPANNVSYGDKSGKTGYIGEAKYDMKYNAVDDITQGKGKADYGMSRYKKDHKGMSRQVSPLNNEGHGGKKGHGHATIVKKIAKKKPIVNKETKERLPKKQK